MSNDTLTVEIWRGQEEGRFDTFQVPRMANKETSDIRMRLTKDTCCNRDDIFEKNFRGNVSFLVIQVVRHTKITVACQ